MPGTHATTTALAATFIAFLPFCSQSHRGTFISNRESADDSIYVYVTLAETTAVHEQFDAADTWLLRAGRLVIFPDDTQRLSVARQFVIRQKAGFFLSKENFQLAGALYDSLLGIAPHNIAYHLDRAHFRSITGNIRDAVTDLQQGIQAKDPMSMHLNDSINPVKKRLKGYMKRCCDGTWGLTNDPHPCKDHGRVCISHEAVHEYYRDYH